MKVVVTSLVAALSLMLPTSLVSAAQAASDETDDGYLTHLLLPQTTEFGVEELLYLIAVDTDNPESLDDFGDPPGYQTITIEPDRGYSRSEFGAGWSMSAGCTTRQQVLRDEALGGSATDCGVSDGSWRSLYDGRKLDDPDSVKVDHVVPLKEAWQSGADQWSPEKRRAFANDLGYRDSLMVVSAVSKRAKDGGDPAEWMPPRVAAQCRYAQAWVAVKWRWELAFDAAEVGALADILRECPDLIAPIPAKYTEPD